MPLVKQNHIIFFQLIVTENHESDAIEPGSDVSQGPENQTELERIDNVFNEEQPAQFHNSRIQTSGSVFCHLLNLF